MKNTNLFTAPLLEKIYELQSAYTSYTNFAHYPKSYLASSLDLWYENKVLSPAFDDNFMLSKNVEKIDNLNLTDLYLSEIEAMDNNGGAGCYLKCNYVFDSNMRVVEDKVNYNGRSLKGANFNKALRVALEVRASQQAYPFYRYTGNGNYEAHPEFTVDKVFDKIATELSKIKQRTMAKGKLVLSANPIDYLTMSENTSNWSSCHSLDGCHAAGALAYMGDANSYVAYLTTNDDVKLFDERGSSFNWNTKQWRAMIYVKPEVGFTVQLHYPFKSELLEQEVVELVKEAFFPNVEIKDITDASTPGVSAESEGPVYIDGLSGSYLVASIEDLSYQERRLGVGAPVHCHECGNLHYEGDTETDALVCPGCGCGSYCDCCGEREHDDYMTWIEGTDEVVCDYCRDRNYTYCEDCEEYHRDDETVEVHYRNSRGVTYQKQVCTGCMEGSAYVICEECEEIFDMDTIPMCITDGGSFCPECAPEKEEQEEE